MKRVIILFKNYIICLYKLVHFQDVQVGWFASILAESGSRLIHDFLENMDAQRTYFCLLSYRFFCSMLKIKYSSVSQYVHSCIEFHHMQ